MNADPTPTCLSAPRGVERLGEHNLRNIFCTLYQHCLDLAVRSDWDDWTCARCPMRHGEDAKPDATAYAHSRPRSPTDAM